MINGRKRRYLPLIGLCCLLMACSSAEKTLSSPTSFADPDPSTPTSISSSDAPSSDDPSSMLTGPGQVLPITAQATIAGETFDLEVARTSQQQSLGLMHRNALPDNRGMLFPFSSPRPTQFWMKNVPVALDMVFVFQGQVQGIAEAPPCLRDPCPTYGPGNLLVDNVIELRAGRAAELGLQPGDQVEIIYLEEGE